MKKLIIPAIVIAAIGGYFYYQNMEPATSEEAIAQEVENAVEEAATGESITEETTEAGVVASNDMEAEGDVFADVPEQMMDTTQEAAEDMEAAVDDIDHAEE